MKKCSLCKEYSSVMLGISQRHHCDVICKHLISGWCRGKCALRHSKLLFIGQKNSACYCISIKITYSLTVKCIQCMVTNVFCDQQYMVRQRNHLEETSWWRVSAMINARISTIDAFIKSIWHVSFIYYLAVAQRFLMTFKFTELCFQQLKTWGNCAQTCAQSLQVLSCWKLSAQ